MPAVRSGIFAEVVSRLQALDDATETELMPSSDPMSFPARHVFDNGQTIIDAEAGVTTYALSFTVEGYLEQAGGAGVHEQLDDLYAATVATLMPDPPLGGLAETIEEGDLRVTVAPLASLDRLAFALDFTLTFITSRDDPGQAA